MGQQWATAGWMLGAGLAACVLVSLIGDGGGPEVLLTMLIRIGVQVGVLWVVFAGFAVMWSGLDDDWSITLARLAAVAVIAGFAGLLVNFVPLFTFGFATIAFVLVVSMLLWTWLDLEPGDAFLIAGLAGITRAMVFMSLFMK